MGKFGRAYGKMLVIWCMSRLGGYTYITSWRFRDDGILMPTMGLTGELEHTQVGDSSPHGSYVGKGPKGEKVWAPSHVHNFYFCLDFDIDGTRNVLEEFNHMEDKPGSPRSSDHWTPIKTEQARNLDGEYFRTWRVVNPTSKNNLGHPRSYELVPGGNGVFRSAEAITEADLWVTRYNPREFPFSSVDPRAFKDALPSYLKDEQSVNGEDLVVWYAMHVHHIPRTEEYPAMPIEWASFQIVPRDFLDASPLRPK
jgi:primary-amine oxidase